MKTRKIIQIATSESMVYDSTINETERSNSILALCNDGTLWYRDIYISGLNKKGWEQIEDIPQPQE
ncbi:hypothetical protein [Rodentibacter haemolyticus]|uniref:Uncharacterized protein n=1 Tax=Rodentibacter haemolyticus TaxID=2778911 RepID=A0ABX6V018_9PAST|nr:hypothetical protein [Rodentibacter haemolyticus]QPB43049.1 hypothetical protein IHV77_02725 [Rodentibacter haemolyticus]